MMDEKENKTARFPLLLPVVPMFTQNQTQQNQFLNRTMARYKVVLCRWQMLLTLC
jgi:hypothetical protein